MVAPLSIVFSPDTTQYNSLLYSLQIQLSLNYKQVPVIVVIIGSYVIARQGGSSSYIVMNLLFSVFFSVYSTAVDTLFICYLEDMERNDGSSSKPFIMSRQLRLLLGKMERSRRGRLVHVKGRQEQQAVFTVGH